MAAQRKPLKHLFPCYFDYLLYFYGDNLFFVRKYLTQSSSLFCLFCSKLTAEVHRERGNKIKYICTLIKLHKQVLFIRNKINRSVGKKKPTFYFCLPKTKWFTCFVILLTLAYLIMLLHLIIKMLSSPHFVPSHGIAPLSVSVIDVFNKVVIAPYCCFK